MSETLIGELRAAYAAAAARAGEERRLISVGRHGIELRIAGSAMASRIEPAFGHLLMDASPPGGAAFTVHAWDAEAGSPLPDGWPEPRPDARDAELLPFHSAWQPMERALSVLAAGREAFYWVPDAAGMPYYDAAAPLRILLNWMLAHRGVQLVHGGVVGMAEGAALIVGRGGSGKSTTALAAMSAGLLYLGDDYVAVELDPSPVAHSLFNSAKLDADHVARLPEIAAALENPARLATEKAVVLVHRHWPERVARSLPLVATLVPSIGSEQSTRLEPLAGGEAMRALAPSTIFQLPGVRGEALARMAALVRALPAYRLVLGSDIPGVGRALRDGLARLAAAA